jgi:hemoglobin-like flavoprotein
MWGGGFVAQLPHGAMNPDFEAIKASYDRCSGSPGFLETFYEHLFAKSPEIPELFKNTDFEKQHKALDASLWQMVMFGTGYRNVRNAIMVNAEIHSRHYLNVKPELYALWLDSLCEAIREHDSEYTQELESLWRTAMQKGIDVMVDAY